MSGWCLVPSWSNLRLPFHFILSVLGCCWVLFGSFMEQGTSTLLFHRSVWVCGALVLHGARHVNPFISFHVVCWAVAGWCLGPSWSKVGLLFHFIGVVWDSGVSVLRGARCVYSFILLVVCESVARWGFDPSGSKIRPPFHFIRSV